MDDRLHPRLIEVLRQEGWDGLTAPQEQAMAPLLAGEHVLLMAPTGHGKTEAALLPILTRLLAERDRLEAAGKPWPVGFKVLYITPLRALNRDLMLRLEHWAEALDLTLGVRHGDTTPYQRSKQAKDPPDLLITTPETLQLLFYGDRLRAHLRTVRFVVVDEVHAIAFQERGAQLAVALERLEEVIAQDGPPVAAKERDHGPVVGTTGFQRVGLSATVGRPDAAARFLAGLRDCRQVDVHIERDKRLTVQIPPHAESDLDLPPSLRDQLFAVRRIVEEHERLLVFQNSRDSAELLVSRSAMLDPDVPVLELHHGSLSPEHRQDVEDRFRRGELRALVATSSLELGIDIGAIDHVVQLHSPRSVARLVQRLGRSGHRVGAVSEGTLLADGPEDALECIAIAAAALDGRLEPEVEPPTPLLVLANQIVALANEYARLRPGWVYEVVRRAGPFRDLDEGMFEAVWRALVDLKTLFEEDGAIVRGGRARRHFLNHISLLRDEKSYRVFDEAAKRSVGTVDDAFVAAGLHPGATFIMAGRTWRVLEIDVESTRVRVAGVKDIGPVPQWAGRPLPVSAMVAGEVAALRGRLADGGPCPLDAASAWAEAARPVEEQLALGLRVPTDRVVAVETARRSITVNVALGTRGNELLGRITAAMLSQRFGDVSMRSDGYRIHFTAPDDVRAHHVEEVWDGLPAEGLDAVLAMVLRESPVLRQQLVHVAKMFGGLPDALDPNRFSQNKANELLSHLALEEATLDALLGDRFDLPTVEAWLAARQAGDIEVVHQAMGPISQLGHEAERRLLRAGPSSKALLANVRQRIESADVLLACTDCYRHWPAVAGELERRFHCRRCGSIRVACLRPWHEDRLWLLKPTARRNADEEKERRRMLRNGELVAGFGKTACLALMGRGVGADTAGRIIQKIADPESSLFWREILTAELQFARTSAFWR